MEKWKPPKGNRLHTVKGNTLEAEMSNHNRNPLGVIDRPGED